jgi:hypothetical protein
MNQEIKALKRKCPSGRYVERNISGCGGEVAVVVTVAVALTGCVALVTSRL